MGCFLALFQCRKKGVIKIMILMKIYIFPFVVITACKVIDKDVCQVESKYAQEMKWS